MSTRLDLRARIEVEGRLLELHPCDFNFPAAEEAGLPGTTFHDLRRAPATALVLANVDLETAQTRLGHSDPRLTLAVDAQATTEADRAAAAAVSRRFAKVLRPAVRANRAPASRVAGGRKKEDPS